MSIVTAPTPIQKESIPDFLIREIINGIPFYYKGYRDVLNKTKKAEEIMADSGLQSFLKGYIFTLLIQGLDLGKYRVFSGEVGSHIDRRNNLGLDIAVYETERLTPDKINTQYIDIPPKIVIEIDVNVEGPDATVSLFEDFMLQKIRNLHTFGVEKLIWIFTRSKTLVITHPNDTWEVKNWDVDVELLEGVTFNVAKYLADNGVKL